MDDNDLDGFDEARRLEILRRMAAMAGKHERDQRIATMTPLEVTESDLAVASADKAEAVFVVAPGAVPRI